MSTYQHILVTTKNNITTVTLNRPNKKNAMSFAMMHELIACAKNIETNKAIRAVILIGAGDAFCSGIDLSDLNHPKQKIFALWELVKPWQSLFQKACLVWRQLPVPVVACLHGHCLGAGLQLAMACDVRIATADCQLAVMEAKWGLVPDMGLTQSALHLVAADVLKELAMTARVFDGQEAKDFGFVTQVSDQPIEVATQLAQELSSRSPDAVLASKRVINAMTKQTATTLLQEKRWQLKLLLGHNRKKALKKVRDSSVNFTNRQFR